MQFIAEICSNHNGDLNRALALVDAAAAAGCTAVKYQLFRIDRLFAPEALRAKPELNDRRRWELPVDFLAPLAERAHLRGLLFGCTPFYPEAIHQLVPLVDFFKVSSYDLLRPDLIAACAATHKPLLISTGMANEEEIAQALQAARRHTDAVTLLHCVSTYPTPPSQCNLAAIAVLRDKFRCAVGWSDHSVSDAVVLRAIHHFGASVVEVHFDLDGEGAEFPIGHNWLPSNLAHLIQTAREGIAADGVATKGPGATELTERAWRADPGDGLRPVASLRQSIDSRRER